MLPLTLALALAGDAHDASLTAKQRLDPGVVPVAQSVHLVLDPAAPVFQGSTTVTLRLDGPRDAIVLDAEGPVIQAAALTPGPRLTVHARDGRVELRPERPLAAGTWTLRLRYEAPVREDLTGLYRAQHGGQPFLVSQLEADDARAVVPCFDEPSFKIPWTVTLTVPAGQVALGNAPVARTRRRGAFTEVALAPTPPLPSYLLAFAVGPFEAVPVQGMSRPGSIYVAPGQGPSAARLAEVVGPLSGLAEAWFGTPMPVTKLDLLVAPEFSYGGMENPGLIVLSDSVLQTPPVDPAADGRLVEVVGHELAHLWFGDLVTPAWWDDLWLNESFAKWMGLRLRRALLDDDESRFMPLAQRAAALARDGEGTTRPIRTRVDPGNVFETVNFLAYAKGQALLDAAEAWIGPEDFQRGLRRYLGEHAHGNATAADLFAALSAASGHDVEALLRPYLDRPGAPIVHLTRGPEGWTARQEGYRTLGSSPRDDAPWPVPLRLRQPNGQVARALLTEASGAIPAAGAWLLPQVDGVGYYVWSLPDDALRAVVAEAPRLPEVDQVSLAHNLVALTRSGDLALDELESMTAAWRADAPPAVLDRLLDVVGAVQDALGDDRSPALSAWIDATWRPVWLRVRGDEGARALTRRLEAMLVEHTADAELLAAREARVQAALAGQPVEDRAALAGALVAYAREADVAFQDQALALAAAAPTPEERRMYLRAFGHVEAADARARAIAWLDAPDRSIADLHTVAGAVFDEASEAAERQDWAMAHHDRLAALTPPQKRADLMRQGVGCDEARLARARDFYLAPERAQAQSARVADELTEAIAQCATRRAHHAPAVARLLAPYAP